MKAIVTGAGRGIGAATVLALAQSSYECIMVARTATELQQTADQIRKQHPAAKLQLEVMDATDELKVVELCNRLERVDLLVNNAGYIHVAPIEDFSTEEFSKIIDINLKSTFLFSRECFKKMAAAEGGKIINISSLSGVESAEKFAGFSIYSAAKAAVVAFTQCLAVEGSPKSILANVVAPGAVNTRMLQEALPGFQTKTQPEDIVKEVMFFVTNRDGQKQTGQIKELTNA